MGKMKRWICCGVAIAGIFSAIACWAQNTNSGDIRGIVTDTTGAIIPGASVTVTDVDKNITNTITSDGAGLYDTGPIVPDHYLITISKEGFKTFVRGPITILIGNETVNAQLAVGATSQQVIVTTELPLLTTESGGQEETMEAQTMQNLPQTGEPDWENFLILQPGAAGDSQNAVNPGQTVSINGNLPYYATLQDGATVTLPMSTNSTEVFFEDVAEVKVSSNAFSAQFGVGSTVYNQVTKGGTDKFHGVGYDYLQNNFLNAAPYGFGAPQTVPFSRYNDVGFTVGGPVKPLKKMYFYFNYDRIINHGLSSGARGSFATVPTTAMENGDFTGTDASGNPFPTIYDPTTQTLVTTGNCTYAGSQYPGGTLTLAAPCVQRKSFASEYGNGNKIPSAMINPAAMAVQKYWPSPTPNIGTASGAGYNLNNFFYQIYASSPQIGYFGRLDYDLTKSNRINMSETEGVPNNTLYYGQGICPVNCNFLVSSNDNAQVTDVETFNSHLINEARMGFTDQYVEFTLEGGGEGWASKLNMPSISSLTGVDYFPNVNVGPNFTLGEAEVNNAVYKQSNFDPSDTVTLIKGRHVLHFGGEILIMRADATNWGSIQPGNFSFNGNYTAAGGTGTSSYDGLTYADFLLGQEDSWSANNSPEYGGRWKAPQFYAQDDWKVDPTLTVNLGLRWEGETGWHDVKGNQTVFDPGVVSMDVTDPVGQGYGQVVQGGMWYGFEGQNGRTSLQAPVYSTVMPRVGFSWQARNNLVFRGGIGLYGMIWSEDQYGGGEGAAFGSSGGTSDATTGLCPVMQMNSTGFAPDTTDPGCGTGVNNGQSAASTYVAAPTTPWAHQGLSQGVTYNAYHTPVPKNYEWSLGVQREFARDFLGEVTYVGNHGWGFIFPVDIDQVPVSQLGANDQQYEPYPLYGSITGSTNNAETNYNALEGVLSKRLSYGLQFSVNYVWSHFLSDMDSSSWGGFSGPGVYQNAYEPKQDYSNSNFDIRQNFKGEVVYRLPFGKGGQFLNRGTWLDEAVGGWQLSSIFMDQGGEPIPIVSGHNTSNSRGGEQWANRIGNPNGTDPITGIPNHSLKEWYNVNAFSVPAPYTFGTYVRNQVRGPGLTEVNFSFGKTFNLWPERNVQFQLRGQATNALNHPSFSQPTPPDLVLQGTGSGNGAGAVGDTAIINGTSVGGRVVQLYGRLSF